MKDQIKRSVSRKRCCLMFFFWIGDYDNWDLGNPKEVLHHKKCKKGTPFFQYPQVKSMFLSVMCGTCVYQFYKSEVECNVASKFHSNRCRTFEDLES